jgi:hypothetical protein
MSYSAGIEDKSGKVEYTYRDAANGEVVYAVKTNCKTLVNI